MTTRGERPAHAHRMVLLVPRQLRRSGMTGDVPYYGGRLTPAHIQAISHPPRPAPARPAPPPSPAGDSLAALQRLREAGVLTDAEYADLRGRLPR
jgi:hypothetical protein